MSYTPLYAIATHGLHQDKTRIDQIAHQISERFDEQQATGTIETMRSLMDASHSYQANLKVLQMAHALYEKTLRLGELH